MQTNPNTQSQSKRELEVGEINQRKREALAREKLYDSQDIIAQMETRIKGLIFILDSYIMSLEVDKCIHSNHIYLQSGMSNLNILLDLLLEDNTKLEENQEYILEMLKKTE